MLTWPRHSVISTIPGRSLTLGEEALSDQPISPLNNGPRFRPGTNLPNLRSHNALPQPGPTELPKRLPPVASLDNSGRSSYLLLVFWARFVKSLASRPRSAIPGDGEAGPGGPKLAHSCHARSIFVVESEKQIPIASLANPKLPVGQFTRANHFWCFISFTPECAGVRESW